MQTADSTRIEIHFVWDAPGSLLFFYKYIYIVDFTCSAFSVPSHHSVFGTVIVSWCALNSKTSASDPINNLSLWCLAAQILVLKRVLYHHVTEWTSEPLCFFLSFQRENSGHLGASVHTVLTFSLKSLILGQCFAVQRCFFMLEALSVVFIFFNNPIRNRVLILVWISHNLITNLKHYLKLFPVLVGQQLLL